MRTGNLDFELKQAGILCINKRLRQYLYSFHKQITKFMLTNRLNLFNLGDA